MTQLVSSDATISHGAALWQPVGRSETTDVVAYALHHGGMGDRRIDPVMARFIAERLVQHLEQVGKRGAWIHLWRRKPTRRRRAHRFLTSG